MKKDMNYIKSLFFPRTQTKKSLGKKIEKGIDFTILQYGGVLKDLAQYDRGAKKTN